MPGSMHGFVVMKWSPSHRGHGEDGRGSNGAEDFEYSRARLHGSVRGKMPHGIRELRSRATE